MHLLAIGWLYVVLMMAAVEAAAPNGSVLGAFFTFALYGVLPLSIALYLLNTPARRARRRAREATPPASAVQPDQRGHAAGGAVAPKREEP